MPKLVSFKETLDSQIDKQEETLQISEKLDEPISDFEFSPPPKPKKYAKKNIPVYIPENLLKDLDKLCNKLGYNRNEMINLMIEKCLKNYTSN